MNDILLLAALNYQKLLNIQYVFVFGHKNKEYIVKLKFEQEYFYHLVGFQHMRDLTQYKRYKRSNALLDVLNKKITIDNIKRSMCYFSDIEPRLKALVNLEYLLDGDFETVLFEKKNYPFHTEIDAEYINRAILPTNKEAQFFFTLNKISANNENEYFCITTFEKEQRDFFVGTRYDLIYKKKIDNIKGTKIEIVNRLKHSFKF